MKRAKLDRPHAGGRLRDYSWNDGPCRLPGTIRIERTHNADWETERVVEGHRDLIRPDFRRRIGRLPLQRMIFRDGNEPGASVDFARGRMHDFRYSQVTCRLHD